MLLKILLIFACIALLFPNTLSSTSSSSEEDETEEFEFDATAFDVEDDDDDEITDEIASEIQIENQKIFENFFNTEFEKIEDRINEMEQYFVKYYLKTDENDDFAQVYFELNVQKIIIKATKEIIKSQKIPSLKKFKNFVTKNGELFSKILQKVKKSVIKIEELLAKLQQWENFESIHSILDSQLYSIQLLKDVIENPTKIPRIGRIQWHE